MKSVTSVPKHKWKFSWTFHFVAETFCKGDVKYLPSKYLNPSSSWSLFRKNYRNRDNIDCCTKVKQSIEIIN